MEQSIHVILTDLDPEAGQLINIVDQEVIQVLSDLSKEREKLYKVAGRLKEKNEQAIRKANKLMWRFIKSHGVKYNEETEAVGVSASDVIYVGPKQRVSENPTAEPQASDKVKAKITKAERRKYNELLEQYQYINEKINEHNLAVESNELKLIDFQLNILKDTPYDVEKQSIVVNSTNGKVFLVNS